MAQGGREELDAGVLEMAALWVVRMQSREPDAAVVDAHRVWLEAHAAHAAAYARMVTIWDRLEVAREHLSTRTTNGEDDGGADG